MCVFPSTIPIGFRALQEMALDRRLNWPSLHQVVLRLEINYNNNKALLDQERK